MGITPTEIAMCINVSLCSPQRERRGGVGKGLAKDM